MTAEEIKAKLAAARVKPGQEAPRDDVEPSVVPAEVKRFTPKITTELLGKGFLRILPPGVNDILHLAPDFAKTYWVAPSPYCRVEGMPVHPEFEANFIASEGK